MSGNSRGLLIGGSHSKNKQFPGGVAPARSLRDLAWVPVCLAQFIVHRQQRIQVTYAAE